MLTTEHRKTVDRAIAAARALAGERLPEGRCIELICADFLSGYAGQAGGAMREAARKSADG